MKTGSCCALAWAGGSGGAAGRILASSGHGDSAVAHRRTAVDVQPSSAEAHEFLADAYDKSGGERAAAALERQRAEQVRAKKPAG